MNMKIGDIITNLEPIPGDPSNNPAPYFVRRQAGDAFLTMRDLAHDEHLTFVGTQPVEEDGVTRDIEFFADHAGEIGSVIATWTKKNA